MFTRGQRTNARFGARSGLMPARNDTSPGVLGTAHRGWGLHGRSLLQGRLREESQSRGSFFRAVLQFSDAGCFSHYTY